MPSPDKDRILPFLTNFARRSHGRLTAESLWGAIVGRNVQAWVANDWQAVVLTEVGPDHVTILAGAGRDRHEWEAEMDDAITAWARALGKSQVFAMVRPGWARFGTSRGYREIHREMRKAI